MLSDVDKEEKIRELLSLNYPVTIVRIGHRDGKAGYYFAYLPDFGPCVCSGTGDTINEAIAVMNKNKLIIFRFLVYNGIPIPAPRPLPSCI